MTAAASRAPPNSPLTAPAGRSCGCRGTAFGGPVLLAYLGKLASDTQRLDGSPGILAGDMAQPIGGPLLGGHASHKSGLDADLWYMPMPGHALSKEEREQHPPPTW